MKNFMLIANSGKEGKAPPMFGKSLTVGVILFGMFSSLQK